MREAPLWLNTDTAAAHIGVTAATLRRLVGAGTVTAYQIGRVRRYRVEDLDSYLESARIRPDDASGTSAAPADPS